MKKILFTLEVLLMLSVLPFFFGMALGRKHHVNQEVNQGAPTIKHESNEAMVAYPVVRRNS